VRGLSPDALGGQSGGRLNHALQEINGLIWLDATAGTRLRDDHVDQFLDVRRVNYGDCDAGKLLPQQLHLTKALGILPTI